jgi:RecJ-like exonuclease
MNDSKGYGHGENAVDHFKDALKQASDKFKCIDRKTTIRIVSHLDADGISAISVVIKALHLDGRNYVASIVPQLDRAELEKIAKEPYNIFIFTDLGSGNLSDIEELFKERTVFILDHHKPKKETTLPNVIHVNPHLFGIDGSGEISGSGVAYLFCRALDEKNKGAAATAVIGIIGDMQEKKGLSLLNEEIIRDAVETGKMKVQKGIRFFGYQTRSLHKLLEYCTDPLIPGVSGDEKGSIDFLRKIGIYNEESGFRTLSQLDQNSTLKLAHEISVKLGDTTNVEDMLWNNYIFTEEKEDAMKEAREFSTLLNACGRMGKPSLGIGACLGDNAMKKKAVMCMNDYKKEIMKAMDFFKTNRGTKNVVEGEGYIIINAQDKVLPTVIGTMASMISKSGNVKSGTHILSLAHVLNNKTKVSLRIAGKLNPEIDLRETLKEAIGKLKEGEYGGHTNAAGAVIPTEREEDFLEIAKGILEKKGLEEKIG